jgi:ABC-type multidrug transport system fused ATPase/permease subunit
MTSPQAGPAELLPVASARQLRHYLRAAVRGRGPLLVVTIAALVAESLLGLIGPIAIGWITQAVADHDGLRALPGPVLLLTAAALAAAAAGWAATVLLARLVLPAVARLREEAVAGAVELPIDAVEAGGTGDLVSRVSGDVELVSDTASGTLGTFVGAGLAILSTLAGLAVLDWRFALAGLLAVPIQAHTLRWYLRTSRPIYAAGRIADGRRASALLTGFTALPTLRALRMGPRQRDRIAAASAASMDYEFQAVRVGTRFFGRLNLAELVGLGAILIVAFLLVRAHLAPIGQATTAALFFAGLFGPINAVLGVFDGIQRAGAGLSRLVGLTTVETARSRPEAPSSVGSPLGSLVGTPVGSPTAALEASRVRFGYGNGPDVLQELSLRIEPGVHVAVVGTTGSGKSTLASLLAGLREPRAGTVRLDGAPPGTASPLDGVVLVTQETHVFAGTVADNLRLGRPEASDRDIASALDAVGARAWIAALPRGTGTVVGAGGHALTASQAQHLALARVLLLDPRYAILDEATAEAGSDAARLLDHAARAVLTGRGAFTVAHRLSQAAAADLILVMEAGRVIEQGNHAELLDRRGAYAALWQSWAQPLAPGDG